MLASGLLFSGLPVRHWIHVLFSESVCCLRYRRNLDFLGDVQTIHVPALHVSIQLKSLETPLDVPSLYVPIQTGLALCASGLMMGIGWLSRLGCFCSLRDARRRGIGLWRRGVAHSSYLELRVVLEEHSVLLMKLFCVPQGPAVSA